ncbi:MAG: phosphopentomutase [Syntrophomonadaceae bacterium]|nr:phosphopentomutase [Syntrophomonadaceae bacterium]
MNKKVILIVLDSVGVGASVDAEQYGDQGCNTLKNTARAVGGLNVPNLCNLGLGNIDNIIGVSSNPEAIGSFGRARQRSKGKDTTTGHWEMMGIILEKAFPVYPNGFPPELIAQFESLIGVKTLGNKVASGTEIIEELGEEHMNTGYPIIYTSADSVFQVAAHEEVISLPLLYEICIKARNLLQEEHGVGRVIARPFIGEPGRFVRTSNRRDYSLAPPPNVLDDILKAGQKVIGIGKIKDIFAGRGITHSIATSGNLDGIDKTLSVMEGVWDGLIFTNLIDFDQLYGHRNDPCGYARALGEFDFRLPEIMQRMNTEDLLIITADHGCDPTTVSTDHTREEVPLFVYSKVLKPNVDLGVRESFADIGASIAEYLGIPYQDRPGKSFIMELR